MHCMLYEGTLLVDLIEIRRLNTRDERTVKQKMRTRIVLSSSQP